MRKVVVILAVIAGLFYALKSASYFSNYSVVLLVLFITSSTILISLLLAILLNSFKEKKKNYFVSFLSNIIISIVVFFITSFIILNITSFIFKSNLESNVNIIIQKIEEYKNNENHFPEYLEELKTGINTSNYIYNVDASKKKFRLSYVLSNSSFTSSSTSFKTYKSETKEWVITQDLSEVIIE